MNIINKLRKYQPIWEQIKKHRKATIIAPANSHPRIIQAVRKEKWRDAGFKFLTSEAGVRYKLYEESDKKKETITFSLVDVTGIKIGDL